MLVTAAFYAFAAVLIGSAVAVITSRNPVHSVLFLILAFFNAAALFLIAGAEFLAMILVIVYVGAVAVLFLFVVMMLDIDFAELKGELARYLPLGLLMGLVVLAMLGIAFGDWHSAEGAGAAADAEVERGGAGDQPEVTGGAGAGRDRRCDSDPSGP